jgi:hypothetical protein
MSLMTPVRLSGLVNDYGVTCTGVLTNVLHLSEVLHQAAIEEKLGMVGLLSGSLASKPKAPPVIRRAPLGLDR